MSFFKSFLLAIVATLALTYIFGVSLMEWFDIRIYLDDEYVQPIKAISLSALVSVVFVIAAIAIVLSVFGGIIFAFMLAAGALMLVSVGVFWPVFLIAIIIWLCCRETDQQAN